MTAPELPDDVNLPIRTPCRCGAIMSLNDWTERGTSLLVLWDCTGPGCDRTKGVQLRDGRIVNTEWMP